MDPVIPVRATTGPLSLVQYAVAQAPLAGETVSGDLHLISAFPEGVLLAAVDGLGHGEEAAAAAQAAILALDGHADEPVIPLLKRCHDALKGTRGAAMSLATLNSRYNTLTWVGVGNVEAVLMRADKAAVPPQETVMLFPGVVGHQLPALRAVVASINPDDLLIFFTDGIRGDFLSQPILGQAPQRIAERICARYAKGTDDALVLVARYTGGGN
jgi:phosphoserine phosphatase RsbX